MSQSPKQGSKHISFELDKAERPKIAKTRSFKNKKSSERNIERSGNSLDTKITRQKTQCIRHDLAKESMVNLKVQTKNG